MPLPSNWYLTTFQTLNILLKPSETPQHNTPQAANISNISKWLTFLYVFYNSFTSNHLVTPTLRCQSARRCDKLGQCPGCMGPAQKLPTSPFLPRRKSSHGFTRKDIEDIGFCEFHFTHPAWPQMFSQCGRLPQPSRSVIYLREVCCLMTQHAQRSSELILALMSWLCAGLAHFQLDQYDTINMYISSYISSLLLLSLALLLRVSLVLLLLFCQCYY